MIIIILLSHQLFMPCGSSIKEEFMPTDGRFSTTQKLKWERSEIQSQNRGTIPIPTCGEKEDRPWNPPAHTVPISCSIVFFFFQSRVGGCQLPSHKPKRIFPALWVLMLSSRLKSARITTHPQKPSFASDAKPLQRMEIAQVCFACKASASWLNAAFRAVCGP